MNSTIKFAATIGLDWADQKHDLWIQPADGSKAEHRQLEHTPEALHEWVAKLRERFGNRPVAIGIETCRGAVISALMAYDFIVFFPINPKALKDYRAAFAVSGAKTDGRRLAPGGVCPLARRQAPRPGTRHGTDAQTGWPGPEPAPVGRRTHPPGQPTACHAQNLLSAGTKPVGRTNEYSHGRRVFSA